MKSRDTQNDTIQNTPTLMTISFSRHENTMAGVVIDVWVGVLI